MRTLFSIAALSFFLTGSTLPACNLDFNEAIPCESDQHCPQGMYCEPADGRCRSGSASTEDTGPTEDQAVDPIAEEEPDGVDEPEESDATEETSPDEIDVESEITE